MKNFSLLALILSSLLTSVAYTSDSDISEIPVRSGESKQLSAVFAFKAYQLIVNEAYGKKDYKEAFDGYITLARVNHKFSQYRLAFMYAHGLGTEADLIKAYGWSRLSQESFPSDHDKFQTVYSDFSKTIKDALTSEELEIAKKTTLELRQQFGNFATALRAKRLINRNSTACGESFIGANCQSIKRTLAFGRNGGDSGGNGVCNMTANTKPSQTCLLYGSVGLPGILKVPHQTVRTVLQNVDQRISQYRPGNVEFGELEIHEPDTESERS